MAKMEIEMAGETYYGRLSISGQLPLIPVIPEEYWADPSSSRGQSCWVRGIFLKYAWDMHYDT